MDQQTFSNLLKRYLNEELSQEEASRLLDSLEDPAMRRQWERAVGGMLRDSSAHGQSDPGRMAAVRERILSGSPAGKKTLLRRLRPALAAAAVLAAVALALYWLRPAGGGAGWREGRKPLFR